MTLILHLVFNVTVRRGARTQGSTCHLPLSAQQFPGGGVGPCALHLGKLRPGEGKAGAEEEVCSKTHLYSLFLVSRPRPRFPCM